MSAASFLKALPFEEIVGQEKALAILSRALKSGRISQAYLFVGPEGVGRETTAYSFFWRLFCEEKRSCGSCRPCLKFLRGVHPDLHIINPAGKSIKIEQIRALEARLQLHPVESPYRLVLLSGAESLTREAGNALLKSLEEPPPQTVFILIAPNPEALLPTIVSRCQLLRFGPLSRSQVERLLVERFQKLPEEALGLSFLCEGSIGRALKLSEKGLLEELFRFEAAISSGHPSQIINLAEVMAALGEDLPLFLELILLWLRQSLVSSLGLGEYPPILPPLPPKSFIIRACEEIEKAFAALEANLNLELFCLSLLNFLAHLWQRAREAEITSAGAGAT